MEAIGKVNLLSWREQVVEKHCSVNSYLECCKSQQASGWVSCSDPPKQDKGRGRKSTTNPTRLVTGVWSSGPDALPKQILGASYFPENQEQLVCEDWKIQRKSGLSVGVWGWYLPRLLWRKELLFLEPCLDPQH